MVVREVLGGEEGDPPPRDLALARQMFQNVLSQMPLQWWLWVVVRGDPWKGVVVREVLGGEEGDPPSPRSRSCSPDVPKRAVSDAPSLVVVGGGAG